MKRSKLEIDKNKLSKNLLDIYLKVSKIWFNIWERSTSIWINININEIKG